MSSLLRYEWRRITTVRATWIVLALAVLFTALQVLLISMSEGAVVDDGAVPPDALPVEKTPFGALVQSTASGFLTLVVLSVIAAMAFGHEYRYGTIRLTLTAFPRRVPVVVAKWLVAMLFVVAGWLISVAVVAIMVVLLPKAYEFSPDENIPLILLRGLLFVVGYATIVFAVTLLTRNLPLGIIIPLVWAIIVEQLILSILGSRFEWLPKVMPISTGNGLAAGAEDWAMNGLAFGVWTVGLLVLASVLFVRRDA